MSILQIKSLLRKAAKQSPADAARFFKTGVGSYAAHDKFIGVAVPDLRKIAKQHAALPIADIQKLFQSPINEERTLALLMLVNQYTIGNLQEKKRIYQFYIKNLQYVNNWNLVDCSAHLIMGAQLLKSNKKMLLTLAKSHDLWERRIAIVSTWYFIRHDQHEWTLKIAKMLLKDEEDLIHKAVGWMLREVGKRDVNMLIDFLDQHASHMPRTMLRYAIEKFSKQKQKIYLLKKKL